MATIKQETVVLVVVIAVALSIPKTQQRYHMADEFVPVPKLRDVKTTRLIFSPFYQML